jgi:hypothetical protein
VGVGVCVRVMMMMMMQPNGCIVFLFSFFLHVDEISAIIFDQTFGFGYGFFSSV